MAPRTAYYSTAPSPAIQARASSPTNPTRSTSPFSQVEITPSRYNGRTSRPGPFHSIAAQLTRALSVHLTRTLRRTSHAKQLGAHLAVQPIPSVGRYKPNRHQYIPL